MRYLFEVKSELTKVLEAVQKDRKLLNMVWKTTGEDTRITAENLGDLAGNHLFDDFPELFGLSEIEGHTIRAYFQEGAINNYNYITELHKEFPLFFENEREEYLKFVNNVRRKRGLEPLAL